MGSSPNWQPHRSPEQRRRDTIRTNLANYYTQARITSTPNVTLTLFTDAAWLIQKNKATASAVTSQLSSIVASFPNLLSVNATGFVDYVNAAYDVGRQSPQTSCYFLSEFRNLHINIDNPKQWNSFLNKGAIGNYFNTWATSQGSPHLSSWENNFSAGNVLVMEGDANNNSLNGGHEQNIYYFNLDSNFGSDQISEESELSTNDTLLLYTEYQNIGDLVFERLLFSRSDAGHLIMKFENKGSNQSQVALSYQFQSYAGYRIENIRFSTPTQSFTINTNQLISAMSQIGVNQDRSMGQLMQVNSLLNLLPA